MNMVDLIVLACSIVNPGACQTHHLLFQSSGSLRACMAQAQPYLAQWVGEHPNLRDRPLPLRLAGQRKREELSKQHSGDSGTMSLPQ